MLDWTLENLSVDEVAELRSIYEPLTESVRALIDATAGWFIRRRFVIELRVLVGILIARRLVGRARHAISAPCTSNGVVAVSRRLVSRRKKLLILASAFPKEQAAKTV